MKNDGINISGMMDSFERVCKARGLRITHQRTEIFRELIRQTNHPTIENVFSEVRKKLKTISLDTVYRTIATFEEYGLVKRVHHIDNSTRYDINLSVHHHLICTQCHKIEDFYWPEFDEMQPPDYVSHWGKMEDKHVVIEGLCSSCSKKTK